MARSILLSGLVFAFAASTASAGPLEARRAKPAQSIYSDQVAYTATEAGTASSVQTAPTFQPASLSAAFTSKQAKEVVPYPRLAKFALAAGPSSAAGAPPSLLSGNATVREGGAPQAYRGAMIVFTYAGIGLSPIGIAIPPAIRTAHVALNGSPYEGHPAKTTLWVASPFTMRVVTWTQDRRGQR